MDGQLPPTPRQRCALEEDGWAQGSGQCVCAGAAPPGHIANGLRTARLETGTLLSWPADMD